MARDEQYDVRKEILRVLMQKVANDQYPSTTMLDMIEEMLTPDEVPAYAELLMERIRGRAIPWRDRRKAFVARLAATGEPERLEVIRPSLEDIYLELVGETATIPTLEGSLA